MLHLAVMHSLSASRWQLGNLASWQLLALLGQLLGPNQQH